MSQEEATALAIAALRAVVKSFEGYDPKPVYAFMAERALRAMEATK